MASQAKRKLIINEAWKIIKTKDLEKKSKDTVVAEIVKMMKKEMSNNAN